MPTILRNLPVPTDAVYLAVQGVMVRIKPYQIPVWVCLTGEGAPDSPPSSQRFVALLDTAHNHTFALQQAHLDRWTGLYGEAEVALGHISLQRRRLTLLAADLWICPNVPGQLAPAAPPPFRLPLEDGIAVHPEDGSNYPRLPLIGMRAIVKNNLDLRIKGWRRSVNLRTRRRWWFFG